MLNGGARRQLLRGNRDIVIGQWQPPNSGKGEISLFSSIQLWQNAHSISFQYGNFIVQSPLNPV